MRLLRAVMARRGPARVAAAVVHGANALVGDRYIPWWGARYRVSLSRRLWTGRYAARYGVRGAREYAVWAPLPFVWIERWRAARSD